MFSMIWNSFIDHVPLWVWLVLSGCAIGAVLYFFSPILLPIWRMIPTPVRVGIIGAIAAGFAYLGGRYKGRKNADEERKRLDAQAIQNRERKHDEIQKLSPDDRRKRLDGWVRDE